MKGPHFFEKRRKELARQEKAKQKADRKASRKAEKDRGDSGDPLADPEITDTEVDPVPTVPDDGG